MYHASPAKMAMASAQTPHRVDQSEMDERRDRSGSFGVMALGR
jgi:hypothetical protein